MDFHILDLIMYFIIGIIIWLVQPQQNKEELGALIGIAVMFIYTIVYLIIFAAFDVNWVDIFKSFNLSEINIKL